MFGLTGRSRRGALILAAALAAVPAQGLAPAALDALSKLERGRWQVRDLEAGAERETVCIGDPMLLAQLEHLGSQCQPEVVEDGPAGGTIRYTCHGRGFGHSTVRVETPRLAKIRGQGMKDNRPFSFRAEARRVGDC